MTSHTNTKQEIEHILREAFMPEMLQVIDESESHRGHEKGPYDGGGHFKVILKSKEFNGVPPVKRHRMVYAKLADLMHVKIHALSLQLLSMND
jgi:BolA protein